MKGIARVGVNRGSQHSPRVALAGALWVWLVGLGALLQAGDLERLRYNNPGLVVDLGVGLYAYPLPMDFDGDGDLDLVVSCPDKPYNGVYFFENPTRRGVKLPVFKPAKRLGPAAVYTTLSWVNGQARVLSGSSEFAGWRTNDWATRTRVYSSDRVIDAKYLRQNIWRFADVDGDGRHDLLVGQDNWEGFGWFDRNDWWRGYDAFGRWMRRPPIGTVHWIPNTGTDAVPVFGEPRQLEAGGRPVETYGAPTPNLADFDGDGDLDLVCGEFLDGLTYYRNDGTRSVPAYAPGVALRAEGKPMAMDLQMIIPHAVDWDQDGDVDLLVGDEDGRVAFVENLGRLQAGVPVWSVPVYFRQEADELKCGALAAPSAYDWDGDGDEDLLSGNTAGYIEFFENLGMRGGDAPRWAAPRRLEVDGKVFRVMAGPSGSIQGPPEAKWGYTTLSVGDWDGDGRPDIVLNSILGRVQWLKNVGSRRRPRLSGPLPVEVAWAGAPPKTAWTWWHPGPNELATQWRTTPVVVDWNRDGRLDLVMLDHEGYLALFEREPTGQRLKPGRRVFVDAGGEPLRLNAAEGGRSGRRKLTLVDWDRDGRLDLLLNSANVEFWRQEPGGDGVWRFRRVGNLSTRNIESHDTAPTTVDWDRDGVRDLVVGAEDGRMYYLRNRVPSGR